MVRKPLESQLKAVRKTFIKNKKALKSAWLSEILRLLCLSLPKKIFLSF